MDAPPGWQSATTSIEINLDPSFGSCPTREVVHISRNRGGGWRGANQSSGNVVNGVYARRLRCFSIVGLYASRATIGVRLSIMPRPNRKENDSGIPRRSETVTMISTRCVLRFSIRRQERCTLQQAVCLAGNYMPRQKGCQVPGSLNPDILF